MGGIDMTLSDQEFANVTKPIETAIGLPNRAYTDDAFLGDEYAQVLGRGWIGIAFESDAAQPGDMYPVLAAGQPLLVVRGHDDQIRVFHNVCRHRGATLLGEPCSKKATIVCPYHGWTYSLEGALRVTPHFSGADDHDHPTLETGTQDLIEVRSGIWNHVVMVNLSSDAVPLKDWTAGLDARWAPFNIKNMAPGGNMTFEFNANWKLVLENFLESYHLPTVHPVLNSFSPIEDHVLVVDELFMGQLSLNYRPSDDGNALPRFKDLPEERQAAGEYLLLFPTLMVSVTPDHYRVTIVTPISATATHQRWQFYFVGPESSQERFGPARDAVKDRVATYTREDIEILERLQAGRRSSGYDGGRFSPFHETTTHHFQKLVARSLNGGVQPGL
jgi:choline monooxygenase